MVPTTEESTDNSPMSPGPSLNVKKPRARKLLHQFSALFDAKQKTALHRMGATKTKRKDILKCGMLWYIIHARRSHTKITTSVNK